MTDTSLQAYPDRSVAMVRAFSPTLERAFLINGAIAVVVAILGTPLIADSLPFLAGTAACNPRVSSEVERPRPTHRCSKSVQLTSCRNGNYGAGVADAASICAIISGRS